ncbi:hypothetical protein Tco_1316312 [Tanacetum coccineum]
MNDLKTNIEAEVDNDQDETEMKKHMEIVLDEEEIAVNAIPLATKPSVIVKEGRIGYFRLIRADESSKGSPTTTARQDDMEEDTQADEEEDQSPSPNKDQPEPSYTPPTQESDSDSSSPDLKKFDNIYPLTEGQLTKYLRKVSRFLFSKITQEQWAYHEEADVSYADLRASIEGYYEGNIAHRDQTDKLVEASMSSLDKSRIAISDLYTGLNIITELLKDIKNAVKHDHVLNKKVIEATEAYTKNSSAFVELLNLVKNFDFKGLKSSVESLKADALRQDEHLAS